ncbi:MAG: thermonuclease family protein [Proteobacteria bacterium]|nr:thermonuclease family protein [Pseudomonadota bacterium]
MCPLALRLIAALALGTVAGWASAQPCLVLAVPSGDTLSVRCGASGAPATPVRVAGIEAPARDQAYGETARQSLSALCLMQPVTVTPKLALRPVGGTVADLSCRNQDAGRHQVRTGMAWADDRGARGHGQPDVPLLHKAAKAQRRGLWADRLPVAPWEWRRAHGR